MDGKSLDLTQDKLEKLKALLPEVFVEDKLDWEKLRASLEESHFAEFGDERYVLNWAGKSEAFLKLQEPSSATLVPCKEESVNFNKTEHLFIEGENLEVLKALQRSYFGKVKMIYIDPPYNTGKDFIYNDKFAEDREDYLQSVGDKDGNGFKINGNLTRNIKEGGHFHSNWLSMMYPRLYLARNLLREDGVIFVSIDDNEVHNLRLIMNEIFGEENFLALISWQGMDTIKNDARHFSNNCEFILCFAKNLEESTIRGFKRTEKQKEPYKNRDDDSRGPYLLTPLHAKTGTENNIYEFRFPNGQIWKPPKGTYPRFSIDTLKKLLKSERIWLDPKGEKIPQRKTYLSEVSDRTRPCTFWSHKNFGSTRQANAELRELIGRGAFDNPKPITLVRFIIDLVAMDDSIILDFFSGSATTAHSVLDLNKEDGGNRKFIMVQMAEPCEEKSESYKAGYKTIADIGKERVRRVIQSIKDEEKLALDNGNGKQDLGFRAFKLQDSNFKKWRTKIKDAHELAEQLKIHVDPVKKGSKTENILYELLLKSGLELTAKIEKKGKVYIINDNELALLLESVSPKDIKIAMEARPQKIIALDRLFNGGDRKDQLKNNTHIQMRDEEIDFETV